jgi:N,N'-diacetylbacillosaminyl-diphospho-undecaprenol alpha-1,3-N-acetylgalactosaminyltransferase
LRICLLVPDDFSTWQFRRGLIRSLRERGHEVYAACSDGEYVPRLLELGVTHIPVDVGGGISPFKGLMTVVALTSAFRKHRIDLLSTFTIKPNIYGALAGRLAGVKTIVAQVSGRGTPFMDRPGLRARALRAVVTRLYALGLRSAQKVWFQNAEDAALFESLGICPLDKVVVIRSGGIDTDEYYPGCVPAVELAALRQELGIDEQTRVVSMVARNNWKKGVGEFIEAAEKYRDGAFPVRFLLMTLEERNADAIPASFLKEKSNFRFQWLGRRHDVKAIMALSDAVVLPSYYGEGVPHSLLEAMALGKPIVTTDNVGCREVIEHNRNGYMIPPRDSGALANAITLVLADAARRAEFGIYSRQKAVAEFSDHVVLRRVLTELYSCEP